MNLKASTHRQWDEVALLTNVKASPAAKAKTQSPFIYARPKFIRNKFKKVSSCTHTQLTKPRPANGTQASCDHA